MANSNNPDQDLGFDPDSPDLADPQIDPPGPAKSPADDQNVDAEKRVDDKQYPPYDTDE